MDTSLDSIWDEPIVQDSPKRANKTQRGDDDDRTSRKPAKRPRQTLFLADSDDDVEVPASRTVQRAPPAQDVDIDALFAEFDDDDDDSMGFKPLPPRLNEAELTRQAEERARNTAPSYTPHQILPSSSPSRDTGSPNKNKGSKDEKEKDEKKEPRRLAKLDENRLLGPSGFPQLIKMTKNFKIKGKGHEATDLKRLLQQYQYWTHQLYPKTQFRDTVQRVEKLCHSRRMNIALSVWRDEAHGRPSTQKDDSDEEEGGDENAILPRSSPSGGSSSPLSGPASEVDMFDRPQQQTFVTPQSFSREEDEQEDFWQSLDEFNHNSSESLPAPTTAANSSMDEDEDMWDIIDGVEKAEQAAKESTAPSIMGAVATTEPPGNINPVDDDDWDDMYL
ncbi:hypothetical protein CVT25_012587 [Psilocybe cyanescens]|uniref:Chromosome segregation in meiosis protein n=1 Tax=Psilocybe cyanescens TaxID=93625 RepID=A0A409X7V4_PSICY|nr:hypothetical protein CVT25_012587 [Psilocybe cyanescens]